jgi:hypothetical protein
VANLLRPDVPSTHHDEAEHRRLIASRVNASLAKDGTVGMSAPLPLMAFEVSDLPSAAIWEGAIVYVPDEDGGAVLAFSDGTDWRRSTDRSVVS